MLHISPPPRKRRRTLPEQGPDTPDDELGSRSSRLKRWALSLGKVERKRIRGLPSAPPLHEPRKEVTDEIQRERPLYLPKERDGQTEAVDNTRMDSNHSIACDLLSLYVEIFSVIFSSSAEDIVNSSTRGVFTIAPADLLNKSAAAAMKLAIGERDDDDDDGYTVSQEGGSERSSSAIGCFTCSTQCHAVRETLMGLR
ncbi:hypothetical protein C8R42DRAFT_643864 [Lentinula raphanica]|nr:hypothetical protein C8R42DRAFT_643864 [Lentinula raphanica]